MKNGEKKEKYRPSLDYYYKCWIIEAISDDTKKAVEYLQKYYNKKLTRILNNYFVLRETEVVQYLNDFYYEIIPDLQNYNDNIELHFFVEYLLLKKVRTQIKDSVYFRSMLKTTAIHHDDNLKHNSVTTNLLFKFLNKKLLIFIFEKYYYSETNEFLIKKYGKKKVAIYNKLLHIIFGKTAEDKICYCIDDNQRFIINILNKDELKRERILVDIPKERDYFEYTIIKAILVTVFSTILIFFISFFV